MKVLYAFLLLFLISDIFYTQTWQQTTGVPEGGGVTSMVVRQSELFPAYNGHIFAATSSNNWPNGDQGGIRRSTDDGATWLNMTDVYVSRKIIEGPDGILYASIWPYPDPEGFYKSLGDGSNWGQPLVTVPSGNNIFAIGVKPQGSVYSYFLGTRLGIYRSTDTGVSWAYSNNGIPTGSWVRDIEIDSSGIIAAATTNGVFISTNNGDQWEIVTGINDTIVSLAFDYDISDASNDHSRLLMGADNSELRQSFRDNDYTLATLMALFTPSDEVADLMVSYLRSANHKMHGVTRFPRESQAGSFHTSTDDGTTWTTNNAGLPPDVKPSALGANVTQGSTETVNYYLGTFGNSDGGAKIYAMDVVVTGNGDETNEIPSSFSLSQNFPNPFNPVTNIKFTLPKSQYVTLKLYDILGNEINTLVNGYKDAGTHYVDFDGSRLSSGVYFYELKTPEFSKKMKMLLMK